MMIFNWFTDKYKIATLEWFQKEIGYGTQFRDLGGGVYLYCRGDGQIAFVLYAWKTENTIKVLKTRGQIRNIVSVFKE